MTTLSICLIATVLEGLLAGKGVKQQFAELKFPRYSLPLQLWYFVGVLYYSIFFVVLFRLLGKEDRQAGLNVALFLTVVIMLANAGWNYFFFRKRNLFRSLVISAVYSVIAVALFVCLMILDRVGAWVLLPYVLYLGYANAWGYQVWKLNP